MRGKGPGHGVYFAFVALGSLGFSGGDEGAACVGRHGFLGAGILIEGRHFREPRGGNPTHSIAELTPFLSRVLRKLPGQQSSDIGLKSQGNLCLEPGTRVVRMAR